MSKLRKLKVATGIWWIEVPDTGLSVVCGCPADSVKHLMKRGLILPTETNGVAHETGPNAILLSDVMLQNGSFCNLAEFPVLQMLYRQGMILPGHPCNTGARPLLIGARDQVNAQLQYIYRGNYGLISEEEMIDAGIDPAKAKAMMRLKLKFAFGAIRHPRELLDTQFVDAEPAVLPGGVAIRRLALNRFEFSYEGETALVDLNLAAHENYDSPYPLGNHQVKREYFAVLHTGDGDGWDINRPSMGSILMYQGKIFLIDAGPNIHVSLQAMGIGINEIDGIFHTHSHDDHFAGLTSLMRSDQRIKYYATPLVRAAVAKKLATLLDIEEDDFAHYFDVRDLAFDQWNDIDGLGVKPVYSPHPVETSIFLFRALWEGGWRTYAHLADIVSLDVLRGMITADAQAPGLSQEWYDAVAADYAVTADVKKVDIGGGLIHGAAQDFKSDRSGKIILSHVARPLTEAERAIGSGAPFGTVDVLIPGRQDFVWRNAYEFLSAYFPKVPGHQLRVLLNNRTVSFNPETILIKEGSIPDEVYLLLTGSVESLNTETGIRNVLSAGAMLGEMVALYRAPSQATYRALNFVQALRLPCDLYNEFVRVNNVFDDISRLQESRQFLRRTWLFGEGLSNTTLNRIATKLRPLAYKTGQTIDPRETGELALVRSGKVRRMLGGDVIDVLAPGDFFGEDVAVFDTPSLFHVEAVEVTEVDFVPGALLRDIPIVRWKLFETFEKRLRAVARSGTQVENALVWRAEYSVNIQKIDGHHQKLFDITNQVLEAIQTGKDPQSIRETLRLLLDYTHYHFEAEEQLLTRYGYTEIEGHQHKHQKLIEQVKDIGERLAANDFKADRDILAILQDWITSHILSEDRRYAPFLNDKGVF